ncbi:hypothetical protein JZ751_013754 [Albula glossodonta]|uniref:KCNMB2 ball/chain domain-containing protein n=1 Tax=Albula glossodonta TaxID=121402 RepID=A0A8T2NTV3_9TELE|nr:hypothetical protein JZ751_013754 [Albula glossodonta]
MNGQETKRRRKRAGHLARLGSVNGSGVRAGKEKSKDSLGLTSREGLSLSQHAVSLGRRPAGVSGRMFLLTGSKGPQGAGHERRTIYQKIREYDLLEKKKTVTALKPGEDRAILLGLIMILSSVMMFFLLGITMVRSYSDSVWTEESSCTVLNATMTAEVNCSYSCGSDCWRASRYPCLQVYVSVNASGKVARLAHNEETQETSSEARFQGASDNTDTLGFHNTLTSCSWCFYVPKCRKDHAALYAIIANISEHLKAQQQVPCYYDPDERQDSVILTRLYTRGALFHSLLWPSCMLVGGTLIILMVKLTQHLSILCEQIGKAKRIITREP